MSNSTVKTKKELNPVEKVIRIAQCAVTVAQREGWNNEALEKLRLALSSAARQSYLEFGKNEGIKLKIIKEGA